MLIDIDITTLIPAKVSTIGKNTVSVTVQTARFQDVGLQFNLDGAEEYLLDMLQGIRAEKARRSNTMRLVESVGHG